MIVEEIEKFRNEYIVKYFGTKEKMEEHYKKLMDEEDASFEDYKTTFTEIPLLNHN